MKIDLQNRFQDQPWHIKLWRYRWYLRIPYDTVRYLFKSDFADGKISRAFSLAIGDAHYRMNWFYTLKEVEHKLLKRLR